MSAMLRVYGNSIASEHTAIRAPSSCLLGGMAEYPLPPSLKSFSISVPNHFPDTLDATFLLSQPHRSHSRNNSPTAILSSPQQQHLRRRSLALVRNTLHNVINRTTSNPVDRVQRPKRLHLDVVLPHNLDQADHVGRVPDVRVEFDLTSAKVGELTHTGSYSPG